MFSELSFNSQWMDIIGYYTLLYAQLWLLNDIGLFVSNNHRNCFYSNSLFVFWLLGFLKLSLFMHVGRCGNKRGCYNYGVTIILSIFINVIFH